MDAAQARFADLYEANYRKVLGFLLRRTGCTSTAQDLTEDVFVVAWRKLASIPPGDDAVYWLYAVARKTLASHRRTTATRYRIAQRFLGREDYPTPTPDDVVVRNDEAQHLLDALMRLRERDREVILLAYWEELPHAAIADLLGIGRGTVDVRLHRAIRRLAKELGPSRHLQVEGLHRGAQKESEC